MVGPITTQGTAVAPDDPSFSNQITPEEEEGINNSILLNVRSIIDAWNKQMKLTLPSTEDLFLARPTFQRQEQEWEQNFYQFIRNEVVPTSDNLTKREVQAFTLPPYDQKTGKFISNDNKTKGDMDENTLDLLPISDEEAVKLIHKRYGLESPTLRLRDELKEMEIKYTDIKEHLTNAINLKTRLENAPETLTKALKKPRKTNSSARFHTSTKSETSTERKHDSPDESAEETQPNDKPMTTSGSRTKKTVPQRTSNTLFD